MILTVFIWIFSKAFDRVSHQKLIYKISDIGIQLQGNILLWIIDFFSTHKTKSNV